MRRKREDGDIRDCEVKRTGSRKYLEDLFRLKIAYRASSLTTLHPLSLSVSTNTEPLQRGIEFAEP